MRRSSWFLKIYWLLARLNFVGFVAIFLGIGATIGRRQSMHTLGRLLLALCAPNPTCLTHLAFTTSVHSRPQQSVQTWQT